MSEENVETVRSIYARWANGDFSAADWADPGIEFKGPEGEHGRGTDVMASRWRDWLGTVDGFTVVPEKFIDAGEDRVLVLTRFGGRGSSSGAPLDDFSGGSLFTFSGEKVTRLALYTGTKEALEAAGLSE